MIRPSKTYSAAKKKCDKYFSLYIRLKYADKYGDVSCVTCGRKKHYKEMDAGHFCSRNNMATRYNEGNVFPQCRYCNRFQSGNTAGWAAFMILHHTAKQLEELNRLAHTTVKFDIQVLDKMSQEFSNKIKILKKEKGIL